MQMRGGGPVNRVELESQVLCAALRQSWHAKDKVGSFTSIRELSHLFPDLLPPSEKEEANGKSRVNYYEVLDVVPSSSSNVVLAAFLKKVRKSIKENLSAEQRQAYANFLNAGFILRKPRLRLSHDLVVVRRWLFEAPKEELITQSPIPEGFQQQVSAELSAMSGTTKQAEPISKEPVPIEEESIAASSSIEPGPVPVETSQISQELFSNSFQANVGAESANAPIPSVPNEKPSVNEEAFAFSEQELRKPAPEVSSMPKIIALMEAAQFIGPLEVQALKAQMELAPNIAVEKLILNAGYATNQEMNSLKLAETLLNQNKITMSQFQVAIYDERTSGLRMAESLQVRGWLSVEVKNSVEEWQ
jgi:hypothetical protein